MSSITTVALCRATLRELPDLAPGFSPSGIAPGIVHLGPGNFHRAHMARYTHELMAQTPEAARWGIVGAGLVAQDRRLIEALDAQDGLFTLVEREGDDERVRIIGSICEAMLACDDSAALLDIIDDDRIAIVSLTVTEHGYGLKPATKRLDPAQPAIAADLAKPWRPHSAIGVLTEAYRRRMVRGGRPFTALSCDNIQHNGRVLREAVLDYADLCGDPILHNWIAEHARFPSTMVDRITPATRVEDRAALMDRFGLSDECPVFCESFSQWIIEDDFTAGRPDWDAVGAQFAADVTPYEMMKLRLLNASHLAISGPARLIGHIHVDAAMRDPLIRRYMIALMDRETGPMLPPVPGIDLDLYKARLIDRFANVTIKDEVECVNTDAALNYLLDPVRDRLAQGLPIDLLALGVAAWLRRMRGVDEAGETIVIRHPQAALLRERAFEGGPDPLPMLKIGALFGDLAGDRIFVRAVGHWLGLLYAEGAARTLAVAAEEQGY